MEFIPTSNVEVRTEEGAWLPAKILEPPADQQRKRNKAFIQYKAIVDDNDPTKPRVEHTALSLLRPEPPSDNAETRFEKNDVVDAFHLDTWWPGLVIGVAGDKHMVGFKDPPDFLELSRNKLRSHWDWASGVWTRAPKVVMRESDFKPGTQVEVDLYYKHRLHASWLPAVFKGQLGDKSFLVQYRYKAPDNGNEDNDSEYGGRIRIKIVNAVVSERQIRPCPPRREDKNFDMGDMVDAFYEGSWWVGDVTKVVKKKEEKYMVKLRITGEEKEFSRSELRCHLEWIGKQWKKLRECQEDGRQSTRSRDSSNNFADATFFSPPPPKKRKGGSFKHTSPAQLCKSKTPVKTSNRKSLSTNDELKIKQQLDSQAISLVVKRGRKQKSQELNQHDADVLRHGIKAKRKLPETLVEHSEDPTTGEKHSGNGIIKSRGSEEPIRDGEIEVSAKEFQVEGSGLSTKTAAHDETITLCMDETHSEDAMECSIEPDGTSNEQNVVAEAGIVTMLSLHEQPLPLSIEISGKTIEGSSNSAGTAKKQCEVRGRQAENGRTGDIEREETSCLPFVPKSPFWKYFESVDAFKRFPQQPHFEDLKSFKMICREGLALGSMHLFSSLVERTLNLQVDDASGDIDDILETLDILEVQGFEVKTLKNHLCQLRTLKLGFEDLENQSNLVETQITKGYEAIGVVDKEISVVDNDINGLKERLGVLKEKQAKGISVKEAMTSQVSSLQSKANNIREGIESIRLEFNSLNAPLYGPDPNL